MSFIAADTLSDICVVLFSNKHGERQALQFMLQLSKRYPSVHFLKVCCSSFRDFIIISFWLEKRVNKSFPINCTGYGSEK